MFHLSASPHGQALFTVMHHTAYDPTYCTMQVEISRSNKRLRARELRVRYWNLEPLTQPWFSLAGFDQVLPRSCYLPILISGRRTPYITDLILKTFKFFTHYLPTSPARQHAWLTSVHVSGVTDAYACLCQIDTFFNHLLLLSCILDRSVFLRTK